MIRFSHYAKHEICECNNMITMIIFYKTVFIIYHSWEKYRMTPCTLYEALPLVRAIQTIMKKKLFIIFFIGLNLKFAFGISFIFLATLKLP